MEHRTVVVDDNVELTLVGLLREYGPAHASLTIEPGQTVREVVQELGFNPELVAMVMVNGRQKSKDHPLRPGDKVKLLPLVGGG
ncbi:MAG TPA: MoaD/ThiS family protein [Anaerolineae bacterium]|nr:MoaD/ThiS family protein [Anaerolineae bacterium]